MIPHLPTLQDDHIILLARDKTTLEDYKHDPKNREVWAMGHHVWGAKNATRIFEAHEKGYIEKRLPEKGDHFKNWITNLGEYAQTKPVYTLHEWPMSLGPGHYEGEAGRRFIPWMKDNNVGKPYIESSIGYMLCAALWCTLWANVRRVSIYGVSLCNTLHYGYQRPNAMYYIGRLEEAGVEVVCPMRGTVIFASAWPSGIYGIEADLDSQKTEF